MIKVDKGIPLPLTRGELKYPWYEMAVGDSFFAAGKNNASLKPPTALLTHGWKWTRRAEGEGYRYWRTK